MAKSKDNKKSSSDQRVSKAVVSRLSLYLRELSRLERNGIETTSSTKLGEMLGFSDAQVRKDLANFGQFGYPGVGYRCSELIATIRQIMGTDQRWPVALVGVGNLGRALLGYRGFSNQGFNTVAAFDLDPKIVGSEIEGIPVYSLENVDKIVEEKSIQLAILAVPAAAAQEVAERLVAAGIRGFLNFAAVTLRLPDEVTVIGVDLAIEMEQLSFAMTSRMNS
ncbi:redox-sensing transcriptional repressor Rex [Bremerella sp. JC817]|uniref:redox-sensing transcriptional repressor Rex n=1 Tax=Bremerella sp. JC817 TaxID=3231756 RepID=UPI003459D061